MPASRTRHAHDGRAARGAARRLGVRRDPAAARARHVPDVRRRARGAAARARRGRPPPSAAYLLLGAAGVPVFAGARGGLGVLPARPAATSSASSRGAAAGALVRARAARGCRPPRPTRSPPCVVIAVMYLLGWLQLAAVARPRRCRRRCASPACCRSCRSTPRRPSRRVARRRGAAARGRRGGVALTRAVRRAVRRRADACPTAPVGWTRRHDRGATPCHVPSRFVHAADLHLGAPFKGVDASDERVRDALVASTHEALGAHRRPVPRRVASTSS